MTNDNRQTGLAKFNATIQADKTQTYLRKVMGKKAESFITSVTSLVANNTLLQDCDPLTVMYSATKATALGLPFDPNLGLAYCIPYENRRKGVKEAQFQLGYKGMVQLALRSGQFKRLNVTDVRDGEFGGIDLLTGDIRLNYVGDRDDKPVVGYVAYFQLVNGFEKALYWTKAQCERHGKRYSQTYASRTDYVRNSSKWTTDFDAMAKKTVLKQLLSKYAPMSVEMQMGVQADQAVIHVDDEGNETLDYVDNEPKGAADFADVAEEAATEANDAKVINDSKDANDE